MTLKGDAAIAGIVPVILAGGSGTRLWPASREALPKHLAGLLGQRSLLQTTAERLLRVARPERVVVVGAARLGAQLRGQLEAVDPGLSGHVILEPVARNTAAATALAACHVSVRFGADAIIWICPSDHLVGDEAALEAAVGPAMAAASEGALVTFGIAPSAPETGFGYIVRGAPLAGSDDVFQVERFVEKPPRSEAEALIEAGGTYWNSGMFLMRADSILEELERYEPDVLRAVREAYDAGTDDAPTGVSEAAFEAAPKLPIDKAVMERSDRVVVVPCDPDWSDVGSWGALWEQLPHDANGNALSGDVAVDTTNDCIVRADHRLVACAGVRDLTIVETRDAVLVADRSGSDAVRRLVEGLRQAERPEAEAHPSETRPWGSFTVLHEGPGFKVKEIVVTPGGRLSLQSHKHRAEHWVVVAGTAEAEVDKTIHRLEANQSVHIPLGAVHRLANPGTVPMHLIEVQCGDYLGEDDIVRYEDVYGRS